MVMAGMNERCGRSSSSGCVMMSENGSSDVDGMS